MPDSFYAKITPVGGPGDPPDPDYGRPGYGGGHPDQGLPGGGGRPSHPIVLPPLPGIWPAPGRPAFPIVIPPDIALPPFPMPPIYIEGTPEHPITLPPGEIWPPLPPEYAGKVVAVIVLGEGKVHWYHVPPPVINPAPPRPTPK